ncbi:hypothetical protein [Sphingomonas melonis]|uniref:hypothetical protein n=1 Tax=Sphingomonas melonis TaxID=152682 RepID=UPI0036C4F57A
MDNEKELQTRELAQGDVLHGMILELLNAMKLATTPYMSMADDPRDAMSAVMSAASMLAGAQFGSLMVLGAVSPQDTRRAVEAAGRNFREGIKIGQSQAARIEREANIGGRA